MTEDTTNIVLEHLRHIRAKVDKNEKEMEGLKIRMTSLERAMVSVRREMTDVFEYQIRQQINNDRIIEHIERIERRLELNE